VADSAAGVPAVTSQRLWILLLAVGGPIWIVAAVITGITEDTILLPYGTFFGVGLIEEGAKAIVFLAAARGLATRHPREGMILGATVGAGFAAFESSGYALKAFLENIDDHGVLNIVGTEAIRAISAPFGHIMWTAILGGAIFAGRRVLPTFAGVVVLHAAWDASNGWAITLTQGILGDGWRSTTRSRSVCSS
jgi:protease PrsW